MRIPTPAARPAPRDLDPRLGADESAYPDPVPQTPSVERTALRWGVGGAAAIFLVAGSLAVLFARDRSPRTPRPSYRRIAP